MNMEFQWEKKSVSYRNQQEPFYTPSCGWYGLCKMQTADCLAMQTQATVASQRNNWVLH